MTLTQLIADYAQNLFDAMGITTLSATSKLIILGLESTSERNLDEFENVKGHFRMPGFKKHVKTRLEQLLTFIQNKGFQANPVGKLGYPLNGQMYLKGEALRAGMGKRGKNTVILHPSFGPRLRLVAVVTNAPLVPLAEPVLIEEENPICYGCSVCIGVCPEKILEPYRMTDPARCHSDSDNMVKKENLSIPCDLCIKLCPAGKKGHLNKLLER